MKSSVTPLWWTCSLSRNLLAFFFLFKRERTFTFIVSHASSFVLLHKYFARNLSWKTIVTGVMRSRSTEIVLSLSMFLNLNITTFQLISPREIYGQEKIPINLETYIGSIPIKKQVKSLEIIAIRLVKIALIKSRRKLFLSRIYSL